MGRAGIAAAIRLEGRAGEEPMTGAARDALVERFRRLMREHGPALWRAAGCYEARAADREDLHQEIWLAVWKALPRFRDECSERTFLFRIAHNRGLTHAWRRRPASLELDEAGEVADPGPGPEEDLEAARRREGLARAVRSLPPPQRQVCALSLEGLTHREIADVVGITENNVAVRLSRARDALRRRLAAGGGSP